MSTLHAKSVRDSYDVSSRVTLITGGAGLLGYQHAAAIAGAGGTPVLLDIDDEGAARAADRIKNEFGVAAWSLSVDITQLSEVECALKKILERYEKIDILINNAARNPKVESKDDNASTKAWSRIENFPVDQWQQDLAVGLTGAFYCSRVFGTHMAQKGKGVICNIASDLAVIAPDQRLYRENGLPAGEQPVKPVTYSVVKTGLIGLTRYLATYWAECGVRVNAISPGGVFNEQPQEFVERVSNLIPLGRMAQPDEYQAAVLFLCSDASSYMTGQNLIVDGGRSCW